MSVLISIGSSILSLPTPSGAFSIPTTPASSTATKVALAPNLIAGPSGMDPYRPIRTSIIDGELYAFNGWDTPRRWDRTNNVWSYLGSAAPTDFTPLSLTGAPGTAIPTGRTARYYLVGYNSVTDKETAPQGGGDVTIANASGVTKDVVIPWTAGALPVEFDKRRIYRALNNTDDYKLIATVADSAATYTDTTADAALLTATSWDGPTRTTLPPAFVDGVEDKGIIYAFERSGDFLRYSGVVRISGTPKHEDFPEANVLQIGADEGTGPPTAYVPFHGSAVVFKRKAVYEKVGTGPATFEVRGLSTSRGTFNRNTAVALDRWLIVLDERGVYKLTPGMYAGEAGSLDEAYRASFQPIFDRMNLGASDLFFSEHLESQGQIVFWVALDFDPVPEHGIVFDYVRNVFVALITRRVGTAFGYLTDAGGQRHPCFGDDMGYLWEAEYAESEGVFAGTNVADLTTGDDATRIYTASLAAFDVTTTAGGAATPFDRYNAAGEVVDENRVYDATPTALTTYLYPSAPFAAGDSVAIGVIPAVAETGMFSFNTHESKMVRDVYLEYVSDVDGSVRLDTARDAADFVLKWEQSLLNGVRCIVPTNTVNDANRDDCWLWRLRISQRYANLGFSIRAIHIHWDVLPGRRTTA